MRGYRKERLQSLLEETGRNIGVDGNRGKKQKSEFMKKVMQKDEDKMDEYLSTKQKEIEAAAGAVAHYKK